MVKVFKPKPRHEKNRLTGTKRSRDELLHVMDLWYKQEVDALSKDIMEVKVCNKRLRRNAFCWKRNHEIATLDLNRTQRELVIAQEHVFTLQNILREVFERHPRVQDEYIQELETQEDLSETESEDWMN